MVFAVNVPLSVGFSVFRIGAVDSFTFTVWASLPTVSCTSNFAVWSISREKAGTVCVANPLAFTVSSYCPIGRNRMLYTPEPLVVACVSRPRCAHCAPSPRSRNHRSSWVRHRSGDISRDRLSLRRPQVQARAKRSAVEKNHRAAGEPSRAKLFGGEHIFLIPPVSVAANWPRDRQGMRSHQRAAWAESLNGPQYNRAETRLNRKIVCFWAE